MVSAISHRNLRPFRLRGYPALKVTVEACGEFFVRDRLEKQHEQCLALDLEKQRQFVLSDGNVARLG